jgi:Fe-S cluster assembly iron-binding protein IscA
LPRVASNAKRLAEAERNGTLVKNVGPSQEAAKQALVDMTSIFNSGDIRISKDAVDQLIETQSNPEIEGATVSYGDEKGLRVYQTRSAAGNRVWEEQVGGSEKN